MATQSGGLRQTNRKKCEITGRGKGVEQGAVRITTVMTGRNGDSMESKTG